MERTLSMAGFEMSGLGEQKGKSKSRDKSEALIQEIWYLLARPMDHFF